MPDIQNARSVLYRRSIRPLLLGAGATLVLAASPVRAQSTASLSSPSDAAAAGDTVQLPSFEVTTDKDTGYRAANSVSASRINTAIADLPFSISAFTQQFINDTQPADLSDVVRYAAGVTSAAKEFNAGEDAFSIRGFSQSPERNGFNEGSGNVYVDPVNIERVEVVKGPSALLYGQVSPGGTVNYITKTPQDSLFLAVGAGGGSDSYDRETVDLNAPLIPHVLLFRFNAAYQNGFAFENIPTHSSTRVFAPAVTWNITPRVTLKLDMQTFYRYEDPAQVYPPNMDVGTPASVVKAFVGPGYGPAPSAALTSAVGVDAAAGYKDAADLGFGGPYPGLPNNFDYDNESDWRRTTLATYDAELDATLSDHWLARANFDYNSNNVTFNQTGVGDVFIAPPGSLVYTPGAGGAVGTWAVSPAWNAMTAAAQTAAEYNFAQQILSNPALSQQAQATSTGGTAGNPAVIGRRPRDQIQWGHFETLQTDIVGDYSFGWGKLKPLVGAYYDKNWGYSQIFLNTGSAASPYYQAWDVNPQSPTFYINQNPTPIPVTKYTSETPNTLSVASDEAFYGVLNASFFDDRLYLVGGARYNQSQSISTNFLGTTPAAVYGQGFRAHYTTPQAGIGYKVTKDSMLYASYSTSYTFSGGFLTSPQLINGVETAVDNGQEKPVTSAGEEIGYKTDFLNGRISSTLSVYKIVQSDGVQTVNTIFSSGTLATTVQGVTIRSQGIEYEITLSPTDHLQIFASIAEDDIRNTQEPVGDAIYLGAHPPYTSKTLANLWSRYSFDPYVRGLWVGFGFNDASQSNGNSVNPYLYYPGYVLFNSAAGYDWRWDKTRFSLIVNFDNMANKFYVPADQEVGLPRRVTVALTAHF